MKIIITNRTPYRDDDLRALVRAACKAAGVRCAELRLSVALRRRVGGHVHGWAHCRPGERVRWRAASMHLAVPRDVDVGELARVALHEAMHLAGASHATMTEEQLTCSGPLPKWAAALAVRLAEAPVVDRAAASADRLAHAARMLRTAETRVKRAETIRRKWKRRLSRLAAAAKGRA